MGTAGVPAQQAATTAFAYAYFLADNTDGQFCTFAKNMKNYAAEIASLKIIGFTLKGEAGKPVQITFKTIGNSLAKNVYTGTNTKTSMVEITIPSIGVGNRVMFSQAVFRINNQSAIALASGDAVKPSAFEFSFMRKLTGVQGSYTTGISANNQGLIDEPTNDGIPEISLKLTFPRHSSVTRLADLGSDARKKMDITFTGGLLAATYYRTFKIEIPHLQYKDVPVTDASGIIQEPVEFILHAATVAPTGMTGITQPFKLSGINQCSVDPLAAALTITQSYPLPGAIDVAGTIGTPLDPPIQITFNKPIFTLFQGDIIIEVSRWISTSQIVTDQYELSAFPTTDNITFSLPVNYFNSYSITKLTTYKIIIMKRIGVADCPEGFTDMGYAYSFSFKTAI